MSNIYLYLIFIIFGLIIGSFLNVVILRFDDLKTVLVGRSHCLSCKRKIPWYELFPVLSYIALWGKCGGCKNKISIQYPLVEAGTALIFALLFWKFGLNSIALYFYLAISAILIVVFVYDILEFAIADWLVISAALLWIIYLIIDFFFIHHSLNIILNSIYGALALGGFLGAMVLLSKERWMGSGDIGLGALLGFLIGWPLVLVSSFLGFFIGALFGIVLVIFKLKKLQSKLPFAPFLIIGFWVTLLWGDKIINWYLSMFL